MKERSLKTKLKEPGNEQAHANSDAGQLDEPLTEDNKSLTQPELFSDFNFQESSTPSESQSNNALEPTPQKLIPDEDKSQKPASESDVQEEEPTITIRHHDHKSLGEFLSEARIQHNLTIEDVTRKTHIRSDYINYLETNDFKKLPSASIYTKSYIRTLCNLYGLDPSILITKYEQSIFQPDTAENNQNRHLKKLNNHDNKGENSENQKPKKPFPLTLGWLMTLLIFFIALIAVIYLVMARHTSVSLPHPSQEYEGNSLITDVEIEQFILPEELPMSELPVPADLNSPELPRMER